MIDSQPLEPLEMIDSQSLEPLEATTANGDQQLTGAAAAASTLPLGGTHWNDTNHWSGYWRNHRFQKAGNDC